MKITRKRLIQTRLFLRNRIYANKGTRSGAFYDVKKGWCLYMEIILCIIVSAITSVLTLKFFAYKYFDVIDKYVKNLIDDILVVIEQAAGKE